MWDALRCPTQIKANLRNFLNWNAEGSGGTKKKTHTTIAKALAHFCPEQLIEKKSKWHGVTFEDSFSFPANR